MTRLINIVDKSMPMLNRVFLLGLVVFSQLPGGLVVCHAEDGQVSLERAFHNHPETSEASSKPPGRGTPELNRSQCRDTPLIWTDADSAVHLKKQGKPERDAPSPILSLSLTEPALNKKSPDRQNNFHSLSPILHHLRNVILLL